MSEEFIDFIGKKGWRVLIDFSLRVLLLFRFFFLDAFCFPFPLKSLMVGTWKRLKIFFRQI